jgi:hypothetical protein
MVHLSEVRAWGVVEVRLKIVIRMIQEYRVVTPSQIFGYYRRATSLLGPEIPSMRWPRLRFSMRGMMIAVALSPIVLYAGQWAGMRWPTIVSVTSTPPVVVAAPPVPLGRAATTSVLPTTVGWIETVRFEFSTGPALLAMAASTALLAAVWVLVASSIRRIKRA